MRYEYLYSAVQSNISVCARVLQATDAQLKTLLKSIHPSRLVTEQHKKVEYKPIVKDMLKSGEWGPTRVAWLQCCRLDRIWTRICRLQARRVANDGTIQAKRGPFSPARTVL